jgi:hypothetical protein
MRSPTAKPMSVSEQRRARGLAWLSDEVWFWRVAALALGTIAALKGLHKPLTWAATQAQLDYSHGFIKRGLLGALYRPLGGNHYRTLTVIFLVELAVFYVVLIWLTHRARLEERFGGLAAAALFSSSYAITYLAHLVGYNDFVNASLAMVLLLIRDARRRFLAALVVVPIALLVHESFLFCFLPLVLLSFVLQRHTAPRGRPLLYAAVLALLAGAFTLATSMQPNMSRAMSAQLATEAAARVDFPLRTDFYQVLSVSLADNIRAAMTSMTQPWWWILQGISLACLLPMFAMLLHLIRRLLHTANDGRWTAVATIAAVAGPLLMHGLGWDVARWNAWCAVAAYLALLLLAMHLPKAQLVLSPAERNAIILIIALNMASGYGLFDGLSIQPYPFFPALLDRARFAY